MIRWPFFSTWPVDDQSLNTPYLLWPINVYAIMDALEVGRTIPLPPKSAKSNSPFRCHKDFTRNTFISDKNQIEKETGSKVRLAQVNSAFPQIKI